MSDSNDKRLLDVVNEAIFKALAKTHTITICKVTGVNTSTVNVKSVINMIIDGESIEYPEFIDVPVISLQGGGSSLSFPIAKNDYCLLFVTERCFDNWWVGGDYQSPLELRMHDFSDGFALVGINPLSGAITIPGKMTFDGDLIIDGNLNVTGDIDATNVTATGDVVADGISLKNHTHSVTVTGSAQTVVTTVPA